MKLEAVAFDLDDTLLRDDRTVSACTVAVLQRAAAVGIRVIPASGRAQGSVTGIVSQLGCVSCYICGNGAELWTADHQLIHRETLTVPLAREIVAFGNHYGVYIQTYYHNRFYYNQSGEYAEAYERNSLLKGEQVTELSAFITQPTIKILMMADEALIARMLKDARHQFEGRASVTCSKPYFLEFNPLLATKGNTLRLASEQLGFSLANTIAFGDSLNDVTMLEAAGHGYAMANARPEVRERFSVCPSNEEDGVAVTVAKWLDEEGCA